jgi:hypothetical protein
MDFFTLSQVNDVVYDIKNEERRFKDAFGYLQNSDGYYDEDAYTIVIDEYSRLATLADTLQETRAGSNKTLNRDFFDKSQELRAEAENYIDSWYSFYHYN